MLHPLIAILFAFTPPTAEAMTDPGLAGSSVKLACRNAAARAADRHDVPKDVLIAMAEVESGSWPYAIGVNATARRADAADADLARRYAGRGYKADDPSTAAAWVRGLRRIGLTSLDVGCLQVNLEYHGQAFASLEEAFDPERNADYAARYLRSLKSIDGSWETAVARYHASRRRPQVAYLCRVRAKLAERGWQIVPDHRCRADPSPLQRRSVQPRTGPAVEAGSVVRGDELRRARETASGPAAVQVADPGRSSVARDPLAGRDRDASAPGQRREPRPR